MKWTERNRERARIKRHEDRWRTAVNSDLGPLGSLIPEIGDAMMNLLRKQGLLVASVQSRSDPAIPHPAPMTLKD